MSTLSEKYKKEVKEKMRKLHNYKNVMEVPRIEKIVINRGLGDSIANPKVIELTIDQFKALSGQVPIVRRAKKSISNFKLRQDQIIGCKVTLRAGKMYDFLTKLIYIAVPKIRDFRGLPSKGFDGRGNYTLGLKEDNIFPEISLEKADKSRGMDITIVTTAKSDKEAFDLLQCFGFPFRTATTVAN